MSQSGWKVILQLRETFGLGIDAPTLADPVIEVERYYDSKDDATALAESLAERMPE